MFTPWTLDQLTVFLTVIDEGTFGAAGRRLGRVQSAVSYAVAQLEAALGTPLFERDARPARPTDAGRRLAAEARVVLAQARELSEVAARLQAGVEPTLRLVIDALYPSGPLLAACDRFREAFPATTLRLEVALMHDAVATVARGEADLGVCNVAAGVGPELAAAWLGEVHLVPVCAPEHPLASAPAPQRGALLERHVQIVHSERTGAATGDQGVLGSRTWRVTDLDLKAALIRRGAGWGSLPVPWVEADLADGRLHRLTPEPWPDGHRIALHAVVRRDAPLGRAGQWFREALRLTGYGSAG